MNRDWIPTTAGILDILAGVPALLGVVALVFAGYMVGAVPDDEVALDAVQVLLYALALCALVAGTLALVGGAHALRRRSFGWMLVGAVAAAVSCPPLGVPALILTVIAEKDVRPQPPAG